MREAFTMIDMCYVCSGTGKDDASWDGECPICRGYGEVDRPSSSGLSAHQSIDDDDEDA